MDINREKILIKKCLQCDNGKYYENNCLFCEGNGHIKYMAGGEFEFNSFSNHYGSTCQIVKIINENELFVNIGNEIKITTLFDLKPIQNFRSMLSYFNSIFK